MYFLISILLFVTLFFTNKNSELLLERSNTIRNSSKLLINIIDEDNLYEYYVELIDKQIEVRSQIYPDSTIYSDFIKKKFTDEKMNLYKKYHSLEDSLKKIIHGYKCNDVSINNSNTYMLLRDIQLVEYPLISISKKKTLKLPRNNQINYSSEFDWGPKGNYLVIGSKSETLRMSPYSNVINIINLDTLKIDAQIQTNRIITNINTDARGQYIAVLAYERELSYWPWDLFLSLVGHPVYLKSFYLEIYDYNASLIQSTLLIENLKNTSQQILWVE